jgi:hypothetical protein
MLLSSEKDHSKVPADTALTFVTWCPLNVATISVGNCMSGVMA